MKYRDRHIGTIETAPRFASWLLVALILLLVEGASIADPPQSDQSKRAAWTTSRIVGSPEPALPYTTERVFPALKFNQCLDITGAPGSDRLFVVEQSGKIFSFLNKPDVAAADLVVDFAKAIPGVKQTYALAFHPNFARNRYCFVCYITADDLPDGSHIARFRMTDAAPPTIDVATETTMLTWLSGGHNGCCLKFGPDGCLYISTGDGTGPNPPDTLKTGQDNRDLLSSILRIDVDHADEGRNYRIPADNPFVHEPGTRGEIWAYGLRNPWRMSFDCKSGDLWVGDVGWELWEMLYRVERGGNYGWGVMEGRQAANPEWPRGPTPFLPPTIDHPHSESSSITDGLTYYGSRLKELHGTHLYGDYDTGKIWGFRFEHGRVVGHRELADTAHRIVGFGEDNSGEFCFLDHTAGTIHHLVPNPQQNQPSTFPRMLSESGLFSAVAQQHPAPGVIAYKLNAEPWADHAVAERFVAVPNELSIKADGATWTFPKDTVLVKTMSLDQHHGDSKSRRKLETQILHFDGTDWMPYTYQWNDEQSDATLVGAAGSERTLEIADADAPNGTRRQVWRFSARAECQRCHNKWSGPPLAFNTPQLHRELAAGTTPASQLDLFARMKLIDPPVPAEKRPQLANPRDSSATLDARARAYLQVNCAHCHRMHAGGAVLAHMHYDLSLDKTNLVGVRPTLGTFGIHAAEVIAPSDPFRSILLYRMSKLGGGRMPHLGSSEVDRDGIAMIHNWIQKLSPDSDPSAETEKSVAKRRVIDATNLTALHEHPSPVDPVAHIDRLLASTSGAMELLWATDRRSLPPPIMAQTVERASHHADVAVRDLFERFLPPDQRIKRLGSVVKPEQILALAADASRGKLVFWENASAACKTCHRIDKAGKDVGPDLTAIGKKLTNRQLLESILEPSKQIEPKYVTHLIETDDGRTLTGLLLSKDEREVALKDVQENVIRVPVPQIERLVPQQQSLMPELLLRDMTAQQAADLLAYLSSLK